MAEHVVVLEGAGFAEPVVRLSAPTSETVSLSYYTSSEYTVRDDHNYFGSGRRAAFSVAPGATTKKVRICLIDNSAIGPNES